MAWENKDHPSVAAGLKTASLIGYKTSILCYPMVGHDTAALVAGRAEQYRRAR